MKILQIIPLMTDAGAERLVLDLSNQLSKSHEVVLCLLFDPQPQYQYLLKELSTDVKVVSLGKKLGLDVRMFPRLFGVIRRLKPDVVHSHLGAFNYVCVWSLCFLHARFFHTIHNDAFREVSSWWFRMHRKFFYASRLICPVTISTESQVSFKAAYNVNSAMIENGRSFPLKSRNFEAAVAEVGKHKRDASSMVYVHLGRIDVQKNQLMLIKAFNRFIKTTRINAILLIIGGVRDDEIMKQMMEEITDNTSVFYLGSRENATDYLYLADFFCLSSIHEGLPISLLEAMACEATPICTPVGGIPSVIRNGESGILSENCTEEAYVQALMHSTDLDQLQAMKASASMDFQRKFGMEVCASRYDSLFKDMQKS